MTTTSIAFVTGTVFAKPSSGGDGSGSSGGDGSGSSNTPQTSNNTNSPPTYYISLFELRYMQLYTLFMN
jgi:hypothetical protein